MRLASFAVACRDDCACATGIRQARIRISLLLGDHSRPEFTAREHLLLYLGTQNWVLELYLLVFLVQRTMLLLAQMKVGLAKISFCTKGTFLLLSSTSDWPEGREGIDK